MQALVIHAYDPFHPTRHRDIQRVCRRRKIDRLAPKDRTKPFICLLNGKPLLRANGGWNRTVRDGDVVAFVHLPQGGGGGGSNPLKIVLTIAISMAAPYIAGAIAPGLTGFGAQLLQGAIGFVGKMLVNALIPDPKPSQSSRAQQSILAASPTYNLAAQGNQARLGAAIPVIYGRHMLYPDFGAQPFTEYAGNEQYLYQLFVVGQGQFDIEQIRLEDTVIESSVVQDGNAHTAAGNFEDIQYQVCYGQPVTLYPANVITSGEVSGQEAITVGDYIGPFVANASGTQANAIGIDVVLPKGLYYANDNGGLDARSVSFRVQARAVDDSGAPLGSFVTLGEHTITKATTTPVRESYRYGVGAGRYEVQLCRTNTKDLDSRTGNDIAWAAMRAYLPGTQNYGAVTMLAMKMRASNQLTIQSSRRINVVATRKLQQWNGTSWTAETATRNPAWVIADIIMASYGMRLPDTRIDPDGLLALANTWDARGDRFDGIFDSQQSAWEALMQVARVGRALPFQQAGAVYVVRDQAQSTPVAMFTMRNIVKNSLKLNYILPNEDSADAVDVEYFDAGTWQTKQVRAALPGSTESNVAKRQLFGCTDRTQAWREGMYMAAANRYRRRMVTFSTEMEGFIPTVGDLIAIQHDVPQWGQSGELVAWDGGTLTATLSEPVTFGAGAHYIALRKRDGSVDGPYLVTAGIDAHEVVLADPPAITPDVGTGRERTHFSFGAADAMYIKARVLSVKPRSLEVVEINGVVESDYVHTADSGAPPSESAWQLPTLITVPVVAGLMARSDPNTAEKMFLSWQAAAGATHYLIEVSDSGFGWTRVGETTSANFTAVATFGARTMIRVAGVGMTRGPWVEISYGASASYMWSGTDSNLMWDVDDTTRMWRY